MIIRTCVGDCMHFKTFFLRKVKKFTRLIMQFIPQKKVKALFILREREHEVAQSCPTLCNPMDCSLPGSSVHGIFKEQP